MRVFKWLLLGFKYQIMYKMSLYMCYLLNR